LKIVNGTIQPTYQTACKALGLLEEERHCDTTVEEAVLCGSPFKLRELVAIMLIFCQLSDALSLSEKYKGSLSDDIRHRVELDIQPENVNSIINEVYNKCLVTLEYTVLSLGGTFLQHYVLPQPSRCEAVLQNKDYLREINMRVHVKGDISAGIFAEILLKIGDRNFPSLEGEITIPSNLCTDVSSLSELTSRIYPDIININMKPIEWLCERAILTPKNDMAAEINEILLKAFNEKLVEYKSFDSVIQSDDALPFRIS